MLFLEYSKLAHYISVLLVLITALNCLNNPILCISTNLIIHNKDPKFNRKRRIDEDEKKKRADENKKKEKNKKKPNIDENDKKPGEDENDKKPGEDENDKKPDEETDHSKDNEKESRNVDENTKKARPGETTKLPGEETDPSKNNEKESRNVDENTKKAQPGEPMKLPGEQTDPSKNNEKESRNVDENTKKAQPVQPMKLPGEETVRSKYNEKESRNVGENTKTAQPAEQQKRPTARLIGIRTFNTSLAAKIETEVSAAQQNKIKQPPVSKIYRNNPLGASRLQTEVSASTQNKIKQSPMGSVTGEKAVFKVRDNPLFEEDIPDNRLFEEENARQKAGVVSDVDNSRQKTVGVSNVGEDLVRYLVETSKSMPLDELKLDKMANDITKMGYDRVKMDVFVNHATISVRKQTGLSFVYDIISVQNYRELEGAGLGYGGPEGSDGKLPTRPTLENLRLNIVKLCNMDINAQGNRVISDPGRSDTIFSQNTNQNSMSSSEVEVLVEGFGMSQSDFKQPEKIKLIGKINTKNFFKTIKRLYEISRPIDLDRKTFKFEKYQINDIGERVKIKTGGSAKLGRTIFNLTKWGNLLGDAGGIALLGIQTFLSTKINPPEETARFVFQELATDAAMCAGAPIGLAILYAAATPLYLGLRIGLFALGGQLPAAALKGVVYTQISRAASANVVSGFFTRLTNYFGRILLQKMMPKFFAAAATSVATSAATSAATAVVGEAGAGFIAASVVPGVNLAVALGMGFYTAWQIKETVEEMQAEQRKAAAEKDRVDKEAAAIYKNSLNTFLANTDDMQVTVNSALADNIFVIFQRDARVPKYTINADGTLKSGSADPHFILVNFVGIYNVADNVYDFYYWKELSSTDFINIANSDNTAGTYAFSPNVRNKIELYLYQNAYWSDTVMDANSKLSPIDPKYNSLIPTREQYYRVLNMQNKYGNDINLKMVKYYHDENGLWKSVTFSPINVDKYYYFPTNYTLMPNLAGIRPTYIGPPVIKKSTDNNGITITNTPKNSPTFNHPYYFQSVDLQIQLLPLFDIFYQKFIMLSGMPVNETRDGSNCFDFTKINTSNVYTWTPKPGQKDPSTDQDFPPNTKQVCNTYIIPDTSYNIGTSSNPVYPSSVLQDPVKLLSLASRLISKLPVLDDDVLFSIDNLFLPIFIDFCNSAYSILRPNIDINYSGVYGLFVTHIIDTNVASNKYAVKDSNNSADNIVNRRYVVKCHSFANQSEYDNLFTFIDKFYKNMINDARISSFHYPINIDTLLNYSYMFYFLGFHNTFVPENIFNTSINTTNGIPSNNGLNKESESYNDYRSQPLFTKPTIEASMVDENSMIRNLNEVGIIYNLIYGVVTDINLQNYNYIKNKYFWNPGVSEVIKVKDVDTTVLSYKDNYINVLYGLNYNDSSKTYIPVYFRPKTIDKTVKDITYKIYDINKNERSPGIPITNTLNQSEKYFYPNKPDSMCGVPVYDSIIGNDPKKPKIKPPGSSPSSLSYTTTNSMMLNNLLLRGWYATNSQNTNPFNFEAIDWVKSAEVKPDYCNIMNVGTILNVMQLYATVLTSTMYNDTGFGMNLLGFFYNMRNYYLNIFNTNKTTPKFNYNKYADLWFAAALGYTVPFTISNPKLVTDASSLTLAISSLQTRNFNLLKSNATSLYFTMSATSFDNNVNIKIIKGTDISVLNNILNSGKPGDGLSGPVNNPVFYTGLGEGTVDYLTSIAIKIPACIGFSVMKIDNSVVFYQMIDVTKTPTVKQDTGVLFSCLSIFPTGKPNINTPTKVADYTSSTTITQPTDITPYALISIPVPAGAYKPNQKISVSFPVGQYGSLKKSPESFNNGANVSITDVSVTMTKNSNEFKIFEFNKPPLPLTYQYIWGYRDMSPVYQPFFQFNMEFTPDKPGTGVVDTYVIKLVATVSTNDSGRWYGLWTGLSGGYKINFGTTVTQNIIDGATFTPSPIVSSLSVLLQTQLATTYTNVNIFSTDTTKGVFINTTFVGYLQSIVTNIKPVYKSPNILFEKRVKYSILQGDGKYINNDQSRSNFINPLDPGLNTIYSGAPTLQQEVQQIVKFFNISMGDSYLSDYSKYITRKQNTQVTQDELNAYSRMAYINTYLLFYVYYFRKPGTKIQGFNIDYANYNKLGDYFNIIGNSPDIVPQYLIDKFGSCVVNYDYYITTAFIGELPITQIGTIDYTDETLVHENYYIELHKSAIPFIHGYTPDFISTGTSVDPIIAEFFNYFVNVDFYENITANVPFANLVNYVPFWIGTDYKIPSNFLYLENPTFNGYFSKTDYGGVFNYNYGPTKNYPKLDPPFGIKNCYVNFSKYITSFSINQTDNSVKFYKGQIRMYSDDNISDSNNIYLIGAGQNLQQNQQNNIFTNMYIEIFNNVLNYPTITCQVKSIIEKGPNGSSHNFIPIRYTTNGGFVYTQMPVNIHIYGFDDPYYNYTSNPLYTKIDAKSILMDPTCIIPTSNLLNNGQNDMNGNSPKTIIENFQIGNDNYNLLYCGYIADNTQNFNNGFFCTGFLYDPDNPRNVSFYRNSSTATSPLLGGKITYYNEVISIDVIPYTPMQIISVDSSILNINTVFFDRGYDIYTQTNVDEYIPECFYMASNFYPGILKDGEVFLYNPNTMEGLLSVCEIFPGNVDGLYTKYVTNKKSLGVTGALLGVTRTRQIVVILVFSDGKYKVSLDKAIRIPSISGYFTRLEPYQRPMGVINGRATAEIINIGNDRDYFTDSTNASNTRTDYYVKSPYAYRYGGLPDFDNMYIQELIQLHEPLGTYGVIFINGDGITRFTELSSILNGTGVYTNQVKECVLNACIHPTANKIYFTNAKTIRYQTNLQGGAYKAFFANNMLFEYFINPGYRMMKPIYLPSIDYSVQYKRVNMRLAWVWDGIKYVLYGFWDTLIGSDLKLKNLNFQLFNIVLEPYPGIFPRDTVPGFNGLYSYSFTDPGNSYLSITGPASFLGSITALTGDNKGDYVGIAGNTYFLSWGKLALNTSTQFSTMKYHYGVIGRTYYPDIITPLNPRLLFDTTTVPSIPDNVNFSLEEEQLLLNLQQAYVNLNTNISSNKQDLNISYTIAVQDWLNAYKLVLQLINCKTTLSSDSHSQKIDITSNNMYSCKDTSGKYYYNLLNLYPSITNISVIWKNANLQDGKWTPVSKLDALDSNNSTKKLFFTQIITVPASTFTYYGINVDDNQIYMYNNRPIITSGVTIINPTSPTSGAYIRIPVEPNINNGKTIIVSCPLGQYGTLYGSGQTNVVYVNITSINVTMTKNDIIFTKWSFETPTLPISYTYRIDITSGRFMNIVPITITETYQPFFQFTISFTPDDNNGSTNDIYVIKVVPTITYSAPLRTGSWTPINGGYILNFGTKKSENLTIYAKTPDPPVSALFVITSSPYSYNTDLNTNSWTVASLKYADGTVSYYLPKDPKDQSKYLTVVSISYDTTAKKLVCVLSDGNIWTSSVITDGLITSSITWTPNTTTLYNNIFITYIKDSFYVIKSDNNVYYYSTISTQPIKLSTSGDYMFIGYSESVGYIKINTNNPCNDSNTNKPCNYLSYRTSKATISSLLSAVRTGGTAESIWDWKIIPNYGYNFTNIVPVPGGFLAIGTRPVNELSARVIIEANDQVLAKKYGEILMNNSTNLLFNGSIKPGNINSLLDSYLTSSSNVVKSNQQKYLLNGIELEDTNVSIKQGNALQLQIMDYLNNIGSS